MTRGLSRRAMPLPIAAILVVSLGACSHATTRSGVPNAGGAGKPTTTTLDKTSSTATYPTLPPFHSPTTAELAEWRKEGVSCSSASTSWFGGGSVPSGKLSWSAHLGSFSAKVTGIENLGGTPGLPQYQAAALTVSGPNGTFREGLMSLLKKNFSTIPRAVGPGRYGSPICLVRFPLSPRPVVLIGAGGPNGTVDSGYACVVAVAINAGGLSKPIIDLPLTRGQPPGGLEGQQLAFDGGAPLLVGANGSFGYAGALTTQPPIVLSFKSGRFVIVTRSHPSLIARTAPGFLTSWRELSRNRSSARANGVIPLAAWAAVTCAVGNVRKVKLELASLERGGWIPVPFVRTTEKQLIDEGYCPS